MPLKIVTLDTNDNVPQFGRARYSAVIREGARQFDPPLIVEVSDLRRVIREVRRSNPPLVVEVRDLR